MLKSPRIRGMASLAASLAAFSTLAVITTLSTPAEAVAPGTNGKIAFAREQPDGTFNIFTINSDGSDLKNLTNQTQYDEAAPAWSPDGTKIAFKRRLPGNNEIFVMNADGSGQVNLTNTAGQDNEPSWSPDGTKIAFQSDRDGNSDIFVMNADGSGQTNITHTPAYDAEPAWSPNGAKLSVTTGFSTFVMDPDGANPVGISDGAGTGASWSPSGLQILYYGDRDSDPGTYVMDPNGLSHARLPGQPSGGDGQAVWSPDGTRIALWNGFDIFTTDAHGNGRINITNSAAHEIDPAWGPTSTQSTGKTIYGTAKKDVIQGTPGDDIIYAKAGNDIVYGNGGNDVIKGGAGNDKLYGGDGDDKLYGAKGRDKCDGGPGTDTAAKSCEKKPNVP